MTKLIESAGNFKYPEDYARRIARAGLEYDGFGFNDDGIHENGTRYDALGYDSRGFDINGIHERMIEDHGVKKIIVVPLGECRPNFDEFGFTVDGKKYDDSGFDQDGLHINGSEFDDEGYDAYGYDLNGIDKDGYDESGEDPDFDWEQFEHDARDSIEDADERRRYPEVSDDERE